MIIAFELDKTICSPYNFLTAKIIEEYAEKIKKWNFKTGSPQIE